MAAGEPPNIDALFGDGVLAAEQRYRFVKIREAARSFAKLILEKTSDGPEQRAALTRLRECVAHGHEGPHLTALREAVAGRAERADVVPFSAKIEAELAELPPEDRGEFLASLGLESAGLDRLIHAGYTLLGLQTYFTAGEQEVRAWTIHRGDTAPKAAGVIHTDFEHGFIRAETVSYEAFVQSGGWKGAREKGGVRSEGKEYVVQDGDVMLFRFNV